MFFVFEKPFFIDFHLNALPIDEYIQRLVDEGRENILDPLKTFVTKRRV